MALGTNFKAKAVTESVEIQVVTLLISIKKKINQQNKTDKNKKTNPTKSAFI